MSASSKGTPARVWLDISGHELRRLLRSAAACLAVVGLLLAGALAIYHGAARLRDGHAVVAAAEPELEEQVRYLRQVAQADDDLGLLLYYLALPLARELEPWAGTAAGLQGVHPQGRQLRLTGLVPQLYQTEIGNPTALHAGHFDLAFVLSLLLPLVLIGLSHDVRSRDDDLGVQWLVRSQPLRLSRLIALRLLLRAGLVSATALFLLGLAAVGLGLPFDGRLLAAGIALLAYVGAWSVVVFFVISLGRSSSFNAMALVGAWVAASVLVPGLLQLGSLATSPVRGGVELTLEQRLNMNARWDEPKATTMAPFLERRPEWSAAQVPPDRFSFPWYYAMHEMGDEHVGQQVAAYHAALERRARWTAGVSLFLPPLALELLFERLAGSDLQATLDHRASIARYHEQLKQVVYPWIYRGEGLSAFQLAALPRHRFGMEVKAPWSRVAALCAQLLLLSVLIPLGMRRLDRDEREPQGNAGRLALAS